MKFLLTITLWCCCTIGWGSAHAQEAWPSPEVKQMYAHAQEYLQRGNYKDAAATYRQAIQLAPASIKLREGLANALYRLADYDGAITQLEHVTTMPGATDSSYRLLAMSQYALHHDKQARKTLQQGIARFPTSGMLYHEQGILYGMEKDQSAALSAWLDGIAHDAHFAQNYYDAALTYLTADNVLWGLLYGEVYLCAIPHDTTSNDTLKQLLFTGYKKLFDELAQKQKETTGFEAAVMQVYSTLTPVVSDGITTENLTMLRTRFIMEWKDKYSRQYPFALFTSQDSLIRSGLFDIYNEWLFGKAESTNEYTAWHNFHDAGIAKIPGAAAIGNATGLDSFSLKELTEYNSRDMHGIFTRHKSKK